MSDDDNNNFIKSVDDTAFLDMLRDKYIIHVIPVVLNRVEYRPFKHDSNPENRYLDIYLNHLIFDNSIWLPWIFQIFVFFNLSLHGMDMATLLTEEQKCYLNARWI